MCGDAVVKCAACRKWQRVFGTALRGVRVDESVIPCGTSRAERMKELIKKKKREKQVFGSCGLHSNKEVERAVRE